MNVLFIIRYFYPFIGGTEKQALALASHLVKRGVHVKVITSRFEKKWPKHEVMDEVEVIRLFSPRVKVLGALFFLFCLAVYLIKCRKNFSIVHTFQIGYTSSLSILMSCLLRKPSVIKLPSSGWGGDVQRARKTIYGKLFLSIAKKATRIVALNTNMEEELKNETFDPSRLCSIMNGVDLMRYNKMGEKGQLRKNLGLSDKQTIIYTGRLSVEKGIDCLISSFSKLRHEICCQLIIIANGPEKKNVNRLLDQHCLSELVTWIEEANDVPEYLNASDIFVLPSRFEGLSNSLLEAMACGLPVISTRVGGSIDLINNGINGLLVDVDNEEQLARAISTVLKDPLLCTQMGRNARTTIEANYDLNMVTDRYIELYKEIGRT